jgi:hypothetical protein
MGSDKPSSPWKKGCSTWIRCFACQTSRDASTNGNTVAEGGSHDYGIAIGIAWP